MIDPFFRYFLASKPDASARETLAAIAKQVGQPVQPDLLHLTFCVTSESPERDPFQPSRIDAALAGQALRSGSYSAGQCSGRR